MAETITWKDTTGTSYLFDGSTLYSNAKFAASLGRQGFFAAPIQLVTQDAPGEPGTQERYVQTLANLLSIPTFVRATSESNLATGRRKLIQITNPRLGLGTLIHTAQDATQRQVTGRFIAGREGDESPERRGPGWCLLDLVLQASDPYWYDTSDTTSTPGTSTSFTLTNNGDLECYPVWTLSGPSSGSLSVITLVNSTTGESLTFTPPSTFNSGKTLVIDAKAKTITQTGVTQAFSGLGDTSILFALAAGANSIAATYSGGGTGFSLGVAWRQRYEGV